MSFNLKYFDEVHVSERFADQARNTARKGMRSLEQRANAKLETIHTQAMSNKRWFGYGVAEFKQLYSDLYDLGQILSANFYVEFEPYDNNSTAHLPLFADNLSGFLVSESNLPILQAEFEPVKIATMQHNQITGITEPELQLNFIETKDGRIMNSIIDWRDLMVNSDGTLNPSASFAMWVTIGVFSKDHGLDYKPFSRRFLVAPSMASVDSLTGQGVSEVLQVPLSLQPIRNFME